MGQSQTLKHIKTVRCKKEALEAKFTQKIDYLESKVAARQNKYIENEKGKYYDQESKRVETTTTKDNNGFNCDICTKEFKSISNLNNFDRKYHMVKGKNIYKCDNCNEKHTDKVKIKCHITKEHISCATCLKVFPTIYSLNIHITAHTARICGWTLKSCHCNKNMTYICICVKLDVFK